MAALSPLRISTAWRVEAPFSAVSHFDVAYTFVFHCFTVFLFVR